MTSNTIARSAMTCAAIWRAAPGFERVYLQIITNVKFQRFGYAVVAIGTIRFAVTRTTGAGRLPRCASVIGRKPRAMTVAKGFARRQQCTVGQINLQTTNRVTQMTFSASRTRGLLACRRSGRVTLQT